MPVAEVPEQMPVPSSCIEVHDYRPKSSTTVIHFASYRTPIPKRQASLDTLQSCEYLPEPDAKRICKPMPVRPLISDLRSKKDVVGWIEEVREAEIGLEMAPREPVQTDELQRLLLQRSVQLVLPFLCKPTFEKTQRPSLSTLGVLASNMDIVLFNWIDGQRRPSDWDSLTVLQAWFRTHLDRLILQIHDACTHNKAVLEAKRMGDPDVQYALATDLETCWLIAEASDLAFEDQHAASLFVLPYIRAFMQD